MTCSFIHQSKPALVMVFVQTAAAGLNVLYKLVADEGMSFYVIVAYRFMFASAFMVPLALVLERKKRPKPNFSILFQAFLCGLFGGFLYHIFYLEGLDLTSATFVTAMNNLIPAVTFILAICFRLEKVGIRTLAGKAKVLGTLMGIGGAMLLIFCKALEINIWSTNIHLLHHEASQHRKSSQTLFGSFFSAASCFCYASWLIIQAKMSEQYPCPYSSSALMCLMAAIQSTVFALFKEKDWDQWKLGFNIGLLTVVVSGIFSSGFLVTLIFWCVKHRGPLFVSVFNPLTLVLVAIVGSLILDEKLHLGSILGSVLIVCGLYVVLWGKGKQMKKMTMLVALQSTAGQCDQSIEIVITSPIDAETSLKQNIEAKKEKYGGKINVLGDVPAEKD